MGTTKDKIRLIIWLNKKLKTYFLKNYLKTHEFGTMVTTKDKIRLLTHSVRSMGTTKVKIRLLRHSSGTMMGTTKDKIRLLSDSNGTIGTKKR